MLKVHIPIVIIGAYCIVGLFHMTGYSDLISIGMGGLFELIYLPFIQTRVEQAKNWIPTGDGEYP